MENDYELKLLEFIENDREIQSKYYNTLLQNKLYEQKMTHQIKVEELEKRIIKLEEITKEMSLNKIINDRIHKLRETFDFYD